jgi:hypothetical protein
MAVRMVDRLLHLAKILGYSGGAVPESHQVPCTSALPQERPTTNAQFKLSGLYSEPREVSSGLAAACKNYILGGRGRARKR